MTPEEKAREIGAEHGRNAAGWWIQENLTKTQSAGAHARQCLEWIEEGDPLFYDSLPYADLSGQWADGYTWGQLAEDCEVEEESDLDAGARIDRLCDIYEEAFNDAVGDEIRQACERELEPAE